MPFSGAGTDASIRTLQHVPLDSGGFGFFVSKRACIYLVAGKIEGSYGKAARLTHRNPHPASVGWGSSSTELDNCIRENKDTETREEAEEAFVSGYEPTGDEGYGEIGCIIRLLNTTPNPKIWHGFCFDGEFLYYPSRFPESPTDRAKIPTTADIEESLRCFVNATTVDITEDFVYDFADDDC